MQEGGSQYGATLQMSPFESAGDATRAHLLGIPLQQPPMIAEESSELATAALADGAEELDKGGVAGNRWPQEETLALLRIRSDMDASFRDATLKGPLWEEVSRKLGQLGYKRSAKKCKEKFENVQKYYKRTKDGRAGRQDGKSYRFFRQLEALYGGAKPSAATAPGGGANPPPPISADMSSSSGRFQPAPLNAIPLQEPPHLSHDFSSENSSGSDSDEQATEEGLPEEQAKQRKRKSCNGDRRGKRKMMAFFESLTRQVMERQEEMQNKFLEMIEKREQDRMIREEAWRRQEMARLAREHEVLAQERAMSATRDATILTFLQKMTGHAVSLPSSISAAVAPPQQTTPLTAKRPIIQQSEQTPPPEPQESTDPAASRWPKSEVHALISLRSGMENKYQEAGPKAPLWEEIASGMRRLGYNRNAKRCKEKWENINKYFKKVKDSKKKRPEDAKTCPYFHQLDALYRRKNAGAGSSSSDHHKSEMEQQEAAFSVSQPLPTRPGNAESDLKRDSGRESEGDGSSSAKKPEDILKDLMDQQAEREPQEDSDKLEETDSDGVEQVEDDDEEEEDEEKAKMSYKIQYQQRPVVNGTSGGGESQSAAAAAAAAAAAGSFMAMVQ